MHTHIPQDVGTLRPNENLHGLRVVSLLEVEPGTQKKQRKKPRQHVTSAVLQLYALDT